MSEFKAGDRVRIKPERADGFIQPYRNWVRNGRAASVLLIDSKRKPKYAHDFQMWVDAREIEHIPEARS